MSRVREQAERMSDPDRSTVEEELKALDWQLSEIARCLSEIESGNRAGGDHAIKRARRHLDTALQRSHRAKQISIGIRVPKS